ncbi:molybdopterin synthase sulfur carrier subunit [Nemania sp. NC0429]|nr:molybdopterin synthase sulfur carrier subunit [Nemania sp. NC0429]
MGAVPKPPKGHFNVLYFASASSFTSREYDTLPAPLPINKLFDTLEERHNGIKDKILSSCLVTVNLNYVDIPDNNNNTNNQDGVESGLVIQESDEVAIIPPVSSG